MSGVEEVPQIGKEEKPTSPEPGEVEPRLRKRWGKILHRTIIGGAMALNAVNMVDSDIRKKVMEVFYGDMPDIKSFARKMREGRPKRADIDPTIQSVFMDKEGRQHTVQVLGGLNSETKTRIENVFDPKSETMQSFIETRHADGKVERVTLAASFEGNLSGWYKEYKSAEEYNAAAATRARQEARGLENVKESDAQYREDIKRLIESKKGRPLQKGPEAGNINR